MFRRLPLLFAAVLVAASASAESPLAAPMRDVERLRGLTFEHDIQHVTIGRDQLPARIREQMTKTMPYTIDDYMQMLRVLQLVEGKNETLMDRMVELYQSQVLAFYDPRTHVYYSIRETPKGVDSSLLDPNTMRDMVVIHELTHALQDQRFQAGAREESLERDGDGELAFHALLEGEATLVMLASMLDKLGQPLDVLVQNPALLDNAMGASDKLIDPDTPRYFVESLKFPYVEGLRLAVEGYRRGGWKMLDKMDRNPPRSTRELLHQLEYFARLEAGVPAKPFSPAPPVATPDLLTVEHLGEFHWRYLLGAPAATGWVDDRVERDLDASCEATVLAETRWDSEESARRFRKAYSEMLEQRGIAARTSMEGTTVRVGYGADAALVARFIGS
jgi:hypothetical protein